MKYSENILGTIEEVSRLFTKENEAV